LLFNRNGQRLDRFAHAMEQPIEPRTVFRSSTAQP
jgi:hypothetical protein